MELGRAAPLGSATPTPSEPLERSFRTSYGALRSLPGLRKMLAIDITFGRDQPAAVRLVASEAEKLGTSLAAALGAAEHWERWSGGERKSAGDAGMGEQANGVLALVSASLKRTAASVQQTPAEAVNMVNAGDLSNAIAAAFKSAIVASHFAAAPIAPGQLNASG